MEPILPQELEAKILQHFTFFTEQLLTGMTQSGNNLNPSQSNVEKVRSNDLGVEIKDMPTLVRAMAKAVAEEVVALIKKIDVFSNQGQIIGTITLSALNGTGIVPTTTCPYCPTLGAVTFSAVNLTGQVAINIQTAMLEDVFNH